MEIPDLRHELARARVNLQLQGTDDSAGKSLAESSDLLATEEGRPSRISWWAPLAVRGGRLLVAAGSYLIVRAGGAPGLLTPPKLDNSMA
jgi:hypothetical protein